MTARPIHQQQQQQKRKKEKEKKDGKTIICNFFCKNSIYDLISK